MSRYSDRKVILNKNKFYKDIVERRTKKDIMHFGLSQNKSITIEQRIKLDSKITHIWNMHDKLWKLASEYYNNPTLWWIIARFNEKPTDSHYSPGDVVYIPFPLDLALEFLS